MQKIYLTNHGVKRIQERLNDWNDSRKPHGFVTKAWHHGRLPNTIENKKLFAYGCKRTTSFMLDYRIFEGYVFVFDTKEPGKIGFITLFKNNLNKKKNGR